MISDIMSEAVTEIDRYMYDSLYDSWYSKKMRTRIIKARNEIEKIRIELDNPLTENERI